MERRDATKWQQADVKGMRRDDRPDWPQRAGWAAALALAVALLVVAACYVP